MEKKKKKTLIQNIKTSKTTTAGVQEMMGIGQCWRVMTSVIKAY
jgi:hypothetical protein